MVHVAQINFYPAPKGLAPDEVFKQWPSLLDIPEAAASSGVHVSVIQVADQPRQVTRNGVDFRFVDLSETKTVAARARDVAALLDDIRADVLHVHSLACAEDAFAISRHLPRLPILFQDHADRLPRWWRRPQWRYWYACAAGVVFTAAELARPFTRSGLFGPQTQVFSIPESTCRFTLGDRVRARAATGLHGDPCVLWVGHLSAGKDPLTVLDGIAQAATQLPNLRLWCAFGSAPLLAEVQSRIARDPRLTGRVHLLGKVPHARIERLMQSADVFVSGSRAESCGYALLEAMACGAVPVVTDIPSFHTLTGGGRVGELWPYGDAAGLADALVRAVAKKTSRAQVRAHFDASLSFAAVGKQWANAYAQVRDSHADGAR